MDSISMSALWDRADQESKAAKHPQDQKYWQGRRDSYQLCMAEIPKPEILQQWLDYAKEKHTEATEPLEAAYWQGRKDAFRMILSEELNDPGFIEVIGTSVFSFEKARREFTPVRPEELVSPEQCIECGATYFHKKGCLHGAGLTTEEFVERMDAAKRYIEARTRQFV
jgi:hypothetical protein